MFICWNNFNPFFEAFPFSKENEKVIFTDFIESLYLIKPLLNWNEFSRFWIDEFTHSFTTKSVVILYLFVYYFRVSYNFHIIMVILIFTNHIDELVSCKLLLPYHLEKGSYLVISYLDLTWMWLWSNQSRLKRLHFYYCSYFYWWTSQWYTLSSFF